MKCPTCMRAKLVRDTRGMPYTYKGESTILPAVRGDYCPKCDECVLDLKELRRLDSLILDFQKKVNSCLVDPIFITKVRKKLKLDQKEAAEIFGGGVNAFSRYENGRTKPPLSLVKLLKVLDRHPNLLAEIRTS